MPVVKSLKVTFFGGAGSVTGANFLLSDDEVNILIDCGFFQGSKVADDKNRESFPYDPSKIKALFITHAHLDHIGRVPQLVHAGYRGPIYSTPATRDISEASLLDSLGVLEKEAAHGGKEPLYSEADVAQAMVQWQAVEYHSELKVGNFSVRPLDAGHILGSSMYEFKIGATKIVFTGDLGNSPTPFLADSETITDADYLVMESVYGDRNHESRDQAREKLEDVIEETMRVGGALMIPAFSIERTQEILHEIEQMMEYSRIPIVPVYLDSPLAIKVTEIYKKYIKNRGDIFRFPQLHFCLTTEESKAINNMMGRKIIIAGSGMSNGGRILHHEKRYLPDPNSTLLLVGYQAAGSMGRRLQEGAKSVTIMGETVSVRARVAAISGYSAHKGSDDLVEFVRPSASTLKHVVLVMGEPASSLFLAQRIRDYLGVKTTAAELGQTLEFVLK